jgi:hypothetical protein
MKASILTRVGPGARLKAMRGTQILTAAALPATLAACVQVSAPEKPIEINLNINIRQEVVVRLQQDVRDLIKENPGVF